MKRLLCTLIIILILLPQPVMAAGYRTYYGLTHAHTAEGGDDGKQPFTTMAGAYKFARDVGKLDFFSLSPHSHMIKDSVFQKIRSTAASANGSGFTAMHGSEWGVISVMGHVGTFMTENVPMWEIATHSDQYNHMYKYFNWLSTLKRGFAIFNHPEVFHFGYYYNPLGDKRVVAMEVWNGPAFDSRIDFARNGISYESLILTNLNRGWHIGMVANQDNHMGTWGRVTRVRTGVWATSNTMKSIEGAYMARRTFATQDENARIRLSTRDARGKERWMGEILHKTTDATITVKVEDADGEGVKQILLYSDIVDNGLLGRMVAKSDGPTLTFQARGGMCDQFFIAKAVQDDGDILWSSPIWITQYTPWQMELNKLLILKKQFTAARKHLELHQRGTTYTETLDRAVRYLDKVHDRFRDEVYHPLLHTDGQILRNTLTEAGNFLRALPIQDARILRRDIKRIVKQIALTTTEKEFVMAFLASLEAADVNDSQQDEAALVRKADALVQAKNFDAAVLIYDLLIENYPANAEIYKLKLAAVYSLLEAFEAAQSLGQDVLSSPSLDMDMAYDAYLAVGIAYKRQADSLPKSQQAPLITLSLKQYQQLLKDYPKLDYNRKTRILTYIGDAYIKLMGLTKVDDEKEAHYKNAVRQYNRALKIAKTASDVVDLNDKISSAALRFDPQNPLIYQRAIKAFEKIIAEYPNDDDAKALHKNIGDLYVRLVGKVSDQSEKDKLLNTAMKHYGLYMKLVPPRDASGLFYEFGRIWYRLKNIKKAISCYEQVEKINWRSRKLEYALYGLASCYRKTGENDKAAAIYRRLLSAFPNFTLCIENSSGKPVENPADSAVGRALSNLEQNNPDDGEVPDDDGNEPSGGGEDRLRGLNLQQMMEHELQHEPACSCEL